MLGYSKSPLTSSLGYVVAADAVRLVMVLPMSGMRISSAFAVPAVRSPLPIRVPADTMPATIRFSHVRIIGFPSPIPRNVFRRMGQDPYEPLVAGRIKKNHSVMRGR